MKATIVIPIKSSLPTLLDCLEGLKEQDQSLIEEVIIVENGSSDIKNLNYPYPYQILHLHDGNRSKARNLGAHKAHTPVIVFLDADIVIESDWIKKVLQSFKPQTLAIQTSIVPKASKNSLLQRIRKSRIFFNNEFSFFSVKKSDPNKIVLNSSAFAIRTEVFKLLNGFDEGLIRHEDFDFTQRLLRLCQGEIIALSLTKAHVYFSGNILDYYLREFDCGFHIVRYHEKWSSTKLSESFKSLSDNTKDLYHRMNKLDLSDDVKVTLFFLEAFYLIGNLFGILKKMTHPYPKEFKKASDEIVVKVVFE